MNKKITDFALGAKWGGLAAKGLVHSDSAADALPKKPSPASIDVSAAAPKPPPVCQRNSRRVRPQKSRRFLVILISIGKGVVVVGSFGGASGSIKEQEFVPVHNGHAVELGRAVTGHLVCGFQLLDQLAAFGNFRVGRFS